MSRSTRKYFIASLGLLCLLLLAAVWFFLPSKIEDLAGPSHDQEQPPSKVVQGKKRDSPSHATRPLIVAHPLLGEVTGAKWLTNQMFRNLQSGYAGPEYPPLDLLLDPDGLVLAAVCGEITFSTIPDPKLYEEVLGYVAIPPGETYSHAPKELLGKIASVKLKPFPPDDPLMGSWIVSMTSRGEILKSGIWFYSEVQFEGEPHPRNVMISTWNDGKINERTHKGLSPSISFEADPNRIPYESPAIPGANRYAATVGIQVATTPGQSGLSRYVTEPWAGLSPWKDEQLDPNYGELLPDELLIPISETVDFNAYQSRLSAGANQWPIKPEVKARLEREAAEKALPPNQPELSPQN
jgi:hypothetical protein